MSVPNIYHSLGREGVQSLREEAGRERVEVWEQAMLARRDVEATHATAQEATTRQNTVKQKQTRMNLRPSDMCNIINRVLNIICTLRYL